MKKPCCYYRSIFNNRNGFLCLMILSGFLFIWAFPCISFGQKNQESKASIWGLVSIPPPLTPKTIIDGLEQGKSLLNMGILEYEPYVQQTLIPAGAGISVCLRDVVNKKILCETQTDAQGKYSFFDFESGEVFATMMVRFDGVLREAKARSIMTPNRSGRTPLPLRTDLITIKGRIVHADGSPASGILIMGTPVLGDGASPEMLRLYPGQFGMTAADGTYELPDLRPAEFTTVAAYLINGKLELSRDLLYASLCIKDVPGMSLFTLEVPLISEESLANARRYNTYINRQIELGRWKQRALLKESSSSQLPQINGFVVIAPLIVINPGFDNSFKSNSMNAYKKD